jgi:hypothetical protein
VCRHKYNAFGYVLTGVEFEILYLACCDLFASVRKSRAADTAINQHERRRVPAAAKRYAPPIRRLFVQAHTDAAQRASVSDMPGDPSVKDSSASRKRADSHQPICTWTPPQARQSIDASHAEYRLSPTTSTHPKSLYNQNGPWRLSNTDYGHSGNTLSPQHSPSNPYSEVRGLSGNWNAPTHVELERTREHRKSLTSVEKLRSKVMGWMRA